MHGCRWMSLDADGAEDTYLLGFRHKKRRPRTSLDGYLVEPGGFEPPSASTPLSVLHA